MLPHLCSPPTPLMGVELRGAESLQSPTLTGPPAWGSNTTLVMRKLYIGADHLFASHVRRILFDCTRRSLVLVLSLLSAYNFIKLLFLFVIPAEVLKVWISRHMLAWSRSRLRFLEKVRLKAGVHLNVVFPPLNMGWIEISRSRFKQYKNCLLILLLYVLRCTINFLLIFGYVWEGIVFLKGSVKLGEIRNFWEI